MADRTLDIILRLKDNASKELKTFGTQVEALQPNFQKMAAVGTAGVLAIGAVMNKAKNDAVSLGESINAVNVVFGDASKEVLDFGKTAAKSAGLSAAAFNQAVVPIGAMLRNMGLSAEEAAKQSVLLTQRAADMASVFNTDVNDALGAIAAGIRGESDPLERYGVSLKDTGLKAYAMAEGISKGSKEMTEQQKTVARLGLLFQQTSKLQGDFVNTADSLANRQRVLAAQMQNISTTLGNAFIPLFSKLANIIQPVVDAIGRFVTENPKLASGILLATFALSGLAAVVGILGLALPAVIAGFSLLLSPVGLIAVAVGALVAGFIIFWEQISAFFAIIEEKTGILTAFKDLWASLVALFNEALRPAFQALFDIIQPFMPLLSLIGKIIGGVMIIAIKALVEGLTLIITVLTEVIAIVAKVAEVLANTLGKAIDFVTSKIQQLIGYFQNLISLMKESGLGNFVSGAVRQIKSFVQGNSRSVDDAVISPNGNIVTTHPDDWLIATKNPASLAGGGGITVNISGNSFMGEDDMAEKVGDKLINILKLNQKL